MHPFIMMGHCDNQSAKYVLEPNVNEIHFSFPIVNQVQGEETSSVEQWRSVFFSFFDIKILDKCKPKNSKLSGIYT